MKLYVWQSSAGFSTVGVVVVASHLAEAQTAAIKALVERGMSSEDAEYFLGQDKWPLKIYAAPAAHVIDC
jgi:hypothetical protein